MFKIKITSGPPLLLDDSAHLSESRTLRRLCAVLRQSPSIPQVSECARACTMCRRRCLRNRIKKWKSARQRRQEKSGLTCLPQSEKRERERERVNTVSADRTRTGGCTDGRTVHSPLLLSPKFKSQSPSFVLPSCELVS